jgi:hypothetical protein
LELIDELVPLSKQLFVVGVVPPVSSSLEQEEILGTAEINSRAPILLFRNVVLFMMLFLMVLNKVRSISIQIALQTVK